MIQSIKLTRIQSLLKGQLKAMMRLTTRNKIDASCAEEVIGLLTRSLKKHKSRINGKNWKISNDM